jgi:hypothetical protein
MSFQRIDGHESGGGVTINMSDKSLAFSTSDELPLGAAVELSVSWPAEVGSPLRMVARGRVVRRDGKLIACTIDQSQFSVNALAN